MKKETKQNRKNRVIARGEVTCHSHIITGECEIIREKEKVIIKAGKNCAIKHLLEKPFVEEGIEQWTEEHKDIDIYKLDHKVKIGEILGRHGDISVKKIADKTYEFIQQREYDPFEDVIRKVVD